MFLLDYDGTLVNASSISSTPDPQVLEMLRALCAEERNHVYIISGRCRKDLETWFSDVVRRPPLPYGTLAISLTNTAAR